MSFGSTPVGGGGAPAAAAAAPRGRRGPRRRAGCPRDRATPARAAAARPARGPPAPRRRGRCCAERGLEPRQGASAQGGGERRGARVAHVRGVEIQQGHGRQRARAQLLRQPLHAVGAGCWLAEAQLLERRQHRAQRAQQRQVVGGEALLCHMTIFASRSSLQLRSPALRPSAAAASWSACSCWRGACVSSHSSLLALPKATATPGSSTLHSWLKMTQLLVAAQRRQRHRAAPRCSHDARSQGKGDRYRTVSQETLKSVSARVRYLSQDTVQSSARSPSRREEHPLAFRRGRVVALVCSCGRGGGGVGGPRGGLGVCERAGEGWGGLGQGLGRGVKNGT